ncbi:MAG: NYN domain-containing protein, partial [Hyphomicrobiaceae bacterium]
MLRWRIRSALYIDFENVPLPPDAIANWLAWLEDGAFEASGHRRHFLQKRVYWNSHAERNRELFQRHGFSAVLVGKFAGLKNGADIRMAMDVVETTYTRAEIDEVILLTGDSDFVPELERQNHTAKRSAIVVTEHRPTI